MKLSLEEFHFDPVSAVITLVVAPIFIYILLFIRKSIQALLKYLIEGILYAASHIATQRMAASLSLRRYARLQLEGQSRYLHVPGVVDVSLDIEKIFVPLLLERATSQETVGHSELFELGSRIRIIGDPGSGKSSVAKRIFRDECYKAISRPNVARLPIFVELRRIDLPDSIERKQLPEWLLDSIKASVTRHAIYNPEKCFESYIRGNGILLVLDGLDEVSATTYVRLEVAINGLSTLLSELSDKNLIILTMRSQFHQQIARTFSIEFPVLCVLKRFSPTDVYRFLTRWSFPVPISNPEIVRIYNELTDRPALREMCTNPLVLSMYVARDQASGQSLAPESRTDFYRQVVDELLIKRRAKQIGSDPMQALLREQRQRILGRIALDHLCDPGQPNNLIPWEAAIAVATEVVGGARAVEVLREISKETGLITEEREAETLRFIHLTFCEFLAALEVVHGRQDGWPALVNKYIEFSSDAATSTRLTEVIPFAAALLPIYARAGAISDVLGLDNDRLAALVFLETKAYHHPRWREFLSSYRKSLLAKLDGVWNVAWLSEIHLHLVIAADADRSQGILAGAFASDAVGTFFQDLAATSADNLVALVRAFARQDAAAAFRVATLCGINVLERLPDVIVDNVDQPAFLAIAIDAASTDEREQSVWRQLFVEAALRSSATARLLQRHDGRPWRVAARETRARHHWTLRGSVGASFYSDCLALVHADRGAQVSQWPMVLRFCRLKAPGGIISLWLFFNMFGYNIVLPIFGLYIPLLVFIMLDPLLVIASSWNWIPREQIEYLRSPEVGIILFAIAMFLGAICLLLAEVQNSRARMLARVLNLQNKTPRWMTLLMATRILMFRRARHELTEFLREEFAKTDRRERRSPSKWVRDWQEFIRVRADILGAAGDMDLRR